MCDPRRLLLGITGGIAAYKTPSLIRLLGDRGIEVKTVLTRAARLFVGPDALRTVSGFPLYTDDEPVSEEMAHIRLARWANLLLICPATANTIAKIAHGIADNLLTTLALSFDGPILVVPAMNSVMWRNRATQANVDTLRQRGIRVLPVAEGPLACGDEGPGRMLSIGTIAGFVLGAHLPQALVGRKVLISSGPTVEPIDPVRVVTNRSSGKMGAALARAAMCMGAEVTVVTGPARTDLPEGVCTVGVETAAQMSQALSQRFADTDICIMAAAVADFRPESVLDHKIKRGETDTLDLTLVPIPDIAASLGRAGKSQFLVCFSLEQDGGEQRAMKKMADKGCDMIVYNRIDTSLDTDTSRIAILMSDGSEPRRFDTMSKDRCARAILIRIAESMGLING